jgi:inner membrane protein
MASLGHVAIGLAAGRLYVSGAGSTPGDAVDNRRLARAMFAFSVVSLCPDADVLAFPLGIPYDAPFGHRGASHSLVAALLLGVVTALAWHRDRRPGVLRASVFTTLVVATHGILDAMTDGGRGVALLFPFSTRRIFLPWRPIPVAPIGIGLLGREGLEVLGFELVAFLPFLLYAFLAPRFRRRPSS